MGHCPASAPASPSFAVGRARGQGLRQQTGRAKPARQSRQARQAGTTHHNITTTKLFLGWHGFKPRPWLFSLALSTRSVFFSSHIGCSRVELNSSHHGGRSRSQVLSVATPRSSPSVHGTGTRLTWPTGRGRSGGTLRLSAGRCHVLAVSPAGALTFTRAAPWHGPPGSQLRKSVTGLDDRGLPGSFGPGVDPPTDPPVTTTRPSPLFGLAMTPGRSTPGRSHASYFTFRFPFSAPARLRGGVRFNVSWTPFAPATWQSKI